MGQCAFAASSFVYACVHMRMTNILSFCDFSSSWWPLTQTPRHCSSWLCWCTYDWLTNMISEDKMDYDDIRACVVELLILVYYFPSAFWSPHPSLDQMGHSGFVGIWPHWSCVKGRYPVLNTGMGLCAWFGPVAFLSCRPWGLLLLGYRIGAHTWVGSSPV